MAYHYHHTHERERTRRSPSPFYDRPLTRRNSKRQRVTLYSDDDLHDDYPSQPSRALTIRPQQPTQVIERYNILNDLTRRHPDSDTEDDEHHYYDSDHTRHNYKHTYHTHHYGSSPSSHSHSHDSDSDRDREFRLKIKATIGLPKVSALKPSSWPGEVFRRKEKWVDEDWERRDRARVVDHDAYWYEEPRVEESTLRVRRIKRTKTEEWKPLRGFRR